MTPKSGAPGRIERRTLGIEDRTMAPSNEDWPVLPHDPLQKLAGNLWRIEGALPHFSMRRVMTVAKRSDGDLVIHSAIALEEPLMREIEALGRPAYLLVPHVRHRMDAPRFKRRYPDIKVLATRAALPKAREVVAVDGTYGEYPPDRDVTLEMLRGMNDSEGAMLVRSEDGLTVVLNEVVFDLADRDSLAVRFALRALGLAPGPRVTRVVKLELVHDKQLLREDLERLARLPDLVRLIVSHERMSKGPAARAALEKAAATL